jgi:hypothetical protein
MGASRNRPPLLAIYVSAHVATVSTSATPAGRKECIEMITNGRKPSARLSRPGITVPLAAVLVTAVLAAAGCGGSSSSANPPAANGGAGNPSSGSTKLVQFANCMRSHGLPNFPDPTAQGTFNLPAGMSSSSQFQAADHACKSLAPPGSLSGQGPTTQQLNQTVKFVSCMRKHGESSFPDPSSNGTFQLNGGTNPIDPNSPQFKSAMSACRALLPPGSGFGTGG